jgi:hypothetical protein
MLSFRQIQNFYASLLYNKNAIYQVDAFQFRLEANCTTANSMSLVDMLPHTDPSDPVLIKTTLLHIPWSDARYLSSFLYNFAIGSKAFQLLPKLFIPNTVPYHRATGGYL